GVVQRGRLGGAATIHYQHQRLLEAGQRVRAPGVRLVVVDEHNRLLEGGRTEGALERAAAVAAVQLASDGHQATGDVLGAEGQLPGEDALDGVGRGDASVIPAERDRIEILDTDARVGERSAN